MCVLFVAPEIRLIISGCSAVLLFFAVESIDFVCQKSSANLG